MTSARGRDGGLSVNGEPSAPKRLGELTARLEAAGRLRTVALTHPGIAAGAESPGSLMVRGVTFDSRRVPAGSLFVAIRGAHSDGHDFIMAAAALGAAAAIVERPFPGAPLPQIVVDDTRRSLATAAAWWYGDPSLEMGIVGITGTDGKTTTSFLATAVLEAAGISTGLITTAAVKIGPDMAANAEHVTTPESPYLQRTLRVMADAGNRAAIVETTSHGLALGRVAEIAYDIAVFTNLTHEHLELHGTFEAYRDAKLSLFAGLGRGVAGLPAASAPKPAAAPWPRTAIVNLDDEAAPLFAEAALKAGVAVITYGEAAEADVRATGASEDAHSLSFEAVTPRWRGRVTLRLAGRFNVHNALAAIAVGEALSIDPAAIREGLAGVTGVPGRMERVDLGQPFGVIVDYAHSPASLLKVLEILGPVAAANGGGLVAVFGSAGERDTQKRPMMGRIAGELCRLVFVTDEDPRGEDGEAILEQIAEGAASAGKRRDEDLFCISDRRLAIETAFSKALPGDIVLLAGKGHEQSIIMSDGPRAWDERAEAVRALTSLGFGRR